jgi:uncharacterized protein DUF1236
MQTMFRAGVFAFGLAVVGSAVQAQVVVPGPVVQSPDDLTLAPDEEVVVREYFIRRRPTVITSETTVRPGSVIPDFVELQPFDEAPVPVLRRYTYFVSPSNKIVVVDPATRKVVRILDR